MADYLTWWIEDQKTHIAPETWRSYNTKLRLHFTPVIGSIRLARLSPLDVRNLISAKVEAGYSSKQVNHIHNVLHAALEDARRMEIVDRNVASFLLTLGLRPGEGLGLQWKSVDFDEQTLRIETTLQRQEGKWVLKDPKTPKSKQTLPLPSSLAETLKAHWLQQQIERSLAGVNWQEWGLVFPRPDGQPSWYSDTGRALAAFCKTAKIPVVTMHELRHSTPSILLSLGVDQRVIMHVLRHSTIVLTANLYTHVADPLVRNALNQIDGVLKS